MQELRTLLTEMKLYMTDIEIGQLTRRTTSCIQKLRTGKTKTMHYDAVVQIMTSCKEYLKNVNAV
jgi:hypothetical protein